MANHRTKSKTAAQLKKEKLRSEIIALRTEGKSPHAIAETLGLSVPKVAGAIRSYYMRLEKLSLYSAQECRMADLEKLDKLWEVYFPRACGNPDQMLAPDRRSAEFCLKIMERRAKLRGLDQNVTRFVIEDKARELAKKHGLDEEELVSLAARIANGEEAP